jgi:hypothetical protein
MSTDSTTSTDTNRARAFDAPDPGAIATVIMREPWPSRAHVLEIRLVDLMVASAMDYRDAHTDDPVGTDFPSGEWAELCEDAPRDPHEDARAWAAGNLTGPQWLTGEARKAWEASGVEAGNLALYNRHHDGPEAARLAAGELEAACYVAAAAFRIIEVIRDDTQGKAARGYAVIEAYPYSDDPVTLATDAIADLLHMVAAEDSDRSPEDVIRTALRNYHAERNGEDVI